MSKIAVVILNWNGRKFLEQFLPSVISFSPPDVDIFVADNASIDDSLAFLSKNYPQIKVLKNPSNKGFAGGYNESLSQISAEYFILLNSDVEVTKNWIEPVITILDSDTLIAACQPKIKSFFNKDHFEHAGAAGGFIDKFGYPFCRGRIFQTTEIDSGQFEDETEIFWATGACLFIRADNFFEAGGFDEDFFAHMEEIDLCWRLKNMGYKIFYTSRSTVYHVGGGTLSYLSPWKTFLNFRNSLYMLTKNLPSSTLLIILFFRLILDGIAGVKFLFEGHWKHFLMVIKAHFSFYGKIPGLLKKRKKIKQKSDLSGIFEGSIVLNYYIKNRKIFSEIWKN